MSDIVRITSDELVVEVSSLGAEMQSLQTTDGRDFLWNGDAAYWTGRSPILFPIVGKAPDNHIAVDGVSYEMGQHGFARRAEWVLTDASTSACRFELESSDETRKIYPFDFLLSLTHSLEGGKLIVTAEVENPDSCPMPFGLGYHPAFLWPLPGAESKPHIVTLDNGAEPLLTRLEGGLVTQDKLPSPFKRGQLTLAHELFEADAMIFDEGAGTGLTYAAEGGPSLKFSFDNLPNLALWQKVGAPFLCVEPWHGTAAEAGGSPEIASRPYTTILPAREKATFTFSVEVVG